MADLTQDELLQQALAMELGQAHGGVPDPSKPPPLPGVPVPTTVKLGGRDFSFTKPEELQSELDRLSAVYAAEAAARARAIPVPQVTTPQPQATPAGPNFSGLPTAPKRWDLDTWADQVKADPIGATDRALGAALGLNDVGASQILTLMAQGMAKQQQELAELKQMQTASRAELEQTRARTEAARFQAMHQEVEIEPGNIALLDQIRNQYNLPFTAEGLHLAYLTAKDSGVPLKLNNRGTQQQTQPQQTQESSANFAGLPSVRSSQSAPAGAVEDQMLRYLDSLPPGQDWRSAVDRFKNILEPKG